MTRKLFVILLGLGILLVLGTSSYADFRFTFNFSEDEVSFSKDGKLPLYPGGFFANPEGGIHTSSHRAELGAVDFEGCDDNKR